MQIPLNLFCLYFLDDEEMAGMVAGNENDATLFDLSVLDQFILQILPPSLIFGTFNFKGTNTCHNLKPSYFLSLNLDGLISKNI